MKYTELEGYLIAVDLDNTIVTGFEKMDNESFEVLETLSKKNTIVIATGRPWRSSKQFYERLKLTSPIINYNGAWVHNPHDEGLKERMIRIDSRKLSRFIDDNKDILVNAFCEVRDNIYLLRETEEIKPYLHLDGGNLHVGNFKDILKENSNGAILFSKPGSEQVLQDYVNDIYKDVLIRHWFTYDTLVSELYNPITSKAAALDYICDHYHLDKEKTIAFGDGHNDIEMIDWANISVAMGDSHPLLIKHAKYTTLGVKEHGVAEFFKTHEF